jgi:hypothetical protein
VRVRRVVLASVAAVSGWGCSLTGSTHAGLNGDLVITQSPAPFDHVTAGQVESIVPDGWVVSPIHTELRSGFSAVPSAGRPDADGFPVGISASWVDATRVGVPSDYYYLAANGPVLSRLTTSANCQEHSDEVYLDRRPSLNPTRWSPGHFMASGEGVCRRGDHTARYAYFVAAPGFGPVHEIGIPASGLYVVVAVLPDDAGAPRILRALIHRTAFGDTPIRDFVAVGGPQA